MSPFPEHLKVNGYYRHGLQGDALILSDNGTLRALYRFSPENGAWQSIFSHEGGFGLEMSDAAVVTYDGSNPESPTRGKVSLDGGTSWSEVSGSGPSEPPRVSGSIPFCLWPAIRWLPE